MVDDKGAVILCSGGLDSVVTAFYVKNKLKYKEITILFFDYGQKSLKEERKCAQRCAKELSAEFKEVNLGWLGKISCSLINKKGKIKRIKRKELKDTSKESAKFYVPCRNLIFLTNALALAESEYTKNKKTADIFVGFKCEGKESYPDTTKSFVNEINKIASISCLTKSKVKAPLIEKDKEDIIILGKKLGVKFENTFSCYNPKKNKQCGYCLACKLRQEGFYWANEKDPTEYHDFY
jgi:7-cyano-7-deazaguanine synthase